MAATNLPTSGRLPSRTTKFGVGRAMAPTADLSAAACVPTLPIGLRSARASDRNPSLDRRAQQRDFTPRLMIRPLSVGAYSYQPQAFCEPDGAHAQAIAEWESPWLRLSFVQPGAPTASPPSGEPDRL